ncbi:MAG: hypothetical protein AB7I24_15525 [Candidatus Nanopelagicales bacterium]
MSDDEYGGASGWSAVALIEAMDLGGCITFVRGRTRDQVLEAFGADGSPGVTLEDLDWGAVNVAVAPYGDGWICIEANGFEGSRHEVLLELARDGGAVASLYWNDDVGQTWSTAQDGAVSTVDVELPRPEFSFGVPPADVVAALAAREEADEWVDGRPLALELAARHVGLPLLDTPDIDELVFHPVIPRPEPIHEVGDDLGQWQYDAPHLGRRIADAGPFAQRALAEWAARKAIEGMDIAADPRAQAVLEQFGRGTSASFEPAQSLYDELHREQQVRYRTDPSRAGGYPKAYYLAAELRLNAVSALQLACHADARTAALEALPRAVYCRAFTEAEMHEQAGELLDGLGVPPADDVDDPPFDPGLGDDWDSQRYAVDRERALAMVRGLEPEGPEPEPEPFVIPRGPESVADPDQVLAVSQALPALLAAWEDGWRVQGAPVEQLLAPGLPPDVVRATLEGLPVAGTAIAEAWFGWHDGAAAPGWTLPGWMHQRLLSIEESLRERERAVASVQAHEASFPPEAFDPERTITSWIDSYLPLLTADDGGTLGVDLDSGLVWYGTHPAPGSGQGPSMQRVEQTLSQWVATQVEDIALPWAQVWRGGAWQRPPGAADSGGFTFEVTAELGPDDIRAQIAELEAQGESPAFGWVSYGPDGPFIVSGDAGIARHSGGFTFTAMSSGDVDDGGYEHEEPGVAAPEPDPQRVRADALRLPALLAEWEREWRDRGADVDALLHPGLPADRVRLELRRAGIDSDPMLAEIWFGWHNGTVDARFQAEASHNVLLSLDEALDERRLIEEAMAHPEWHWTAHTSAPLFPGFLPLFSDMRTEHIRYTLAIDLGSSTLWTTHWEPDGSAQILPVPTTPMHTPTLADTVETNWLHWLREDDLRWNGKRWR